MLQPWAHSRNRPTATNDKNKSFLCIFVVISMVGTLSGKSLKLLPSDVILKLKCAKFDFGWSSATDPAGGAYSAPPNPIAGFKRAYF